MFRSLFEELPRSIKHPQNKMNNDFVQFDHIIINQNIKTEDLNAEFSPTLILRIQKKFQIQHIFQ